ncbi:MAG: hypothetical protein KH050_01375 [Clostridiaceae bacterium]|nr:hypothetical protein [Clostridiaceae bacterium]
MKMKNVIAFALSASLLSSTASAIDLFVDGKLLKPDVSPVIIESRTFVPMRTIFEALDSDVQWDAKTQTATATKNSSSVSISINNKTAYVNGSATSLDVPAKIVNNRTMVPVRFVSESLNANVRWEKDTQTVYVATKPEYNGYTLVPDIIYSTAADESGLGDTFMFADGVIVDTQDVGGYRTKILQTEQGKIALMELAYNDEFSLLQPQTAARVCFMYLGYSEVLKMPAGVYMETGNLNTSITYPGQNNSSNPSNPTNPDKPIEPSKPVIPENPYKPPVIEPEKPDSGYHGTVYVTPTGKRYHYSASCGGKNATATTLENAKSRGLTPCSKCAK